MARREAWAHRKEKPPVNGDNLFPASSCRNKGSLKHRPITTTSPEGLIPHGPSPTQLPGLESSCGPREIAPKFG